MQVDRRQHRRVPVLWRLVFYANRFFGNGTVLDISPMGWRVAGLLGVPTDTALRMRLWPGDSQYHYMEIEEAKVLWMSDHQFAIAIKRLHPKDEPMMFELERRMLGSRSVIPMDMHPSKIHKFVM